jgi:SAM-dependent methyltransferase
MHPTAYENCVKFFNKYISSLLLSELKVIDFGAFDTNGCLRPIFKGCTYTGLDMSAGPNVDVVCTGDKTPFENNSFDVVVSSSNFEHDECFWMTFLEMSRIVKPGGYIYINAPSSGFYHGFPGDCWRFFADAGKALTKWANKNGHNIQLVETYIDSRGEWKDNVSIYRKI